MKILLLCSWFPNKYDPGEGLFIKRHAKIIGQEHDVTILYIYEDPAIDRISFLSEGADSYNVITVSTPRTKGLLKKLNKYRNYRTIADRVWKEFGNDQPDLVHVHVAFPAGLAALYLKRKYGVPYVISEHWTGYTGDSPAFFKESVFRKWWTRKIFNGASYVSAVSGFLANGLKQIKLAKKVLVVPNVVDTGDPRNFNDLKEPPEVLTISDLRDDIKNISGLINAWKVINEKTSAVLNIVGEGKDRESLQSRVQEAGLNDCIRFHGFIEPEKLEKIFKTSSLFVLNSKLETFSIVVAEAIGNGLPVVVTKSGAPEEYVTDKVGVLVDQNQTALVNGIIQVLEGLGQYDPSYMHSYISDKFGGDVIAKGFKEFYSSFDLKN